MSTVTRILEKRASRAIVVTTFIIQVLVCYIAFSIAHDEFTHSVANAHREILPPLTGLLRVSYPYFWVLPLSAIAAVVCSMRRQPTSTFRLTILIATFTLADLAIAILLLGGLYYGNQTFVGGAR